MTRNQSHDGRNALRVAGAVGLVTLAGAGYLAVRMASRRQRPAKRRPDMPTLAGGRGAHVERTVTILGSPADLYRIWRDLERLPELMSHLESVAVLDPVRSRWTARGPADIRVTWEAEIVADEPDRLIAWRSVGQSQVENAGSVTFTRAPGNRGTEVKVICTYAPPAGQVGSAIATFFRGKPDQEIQEDLRRFKQLYEAGEVATSGAVPRRSGALAGSR